MKKKTCWSIREKGRENRNARTRIRNSEEENRGGTGEEARRSAQHSRGICLTRSSLESGFRPEYHISQRVAIGVANSVQVKLDDNTKLLVHRSIATGAFHSFVMCIRVRLYELCMHGIRGTRRREEVSRHPIRPSSPPPAEFPGPSARTSPLLSAPSHESGNVDALMANPEHSLSPRHDFGGIFGACAPVAVLFFFFLELLFLATLLALHNDLIYSREYIASDNAHARNRMDDT